MNKIIKKLPRFTAAVIIFLQIAVFSLGLQGCAKNTAEPGAANTDITQKSENGTSAVKPTADPNDIPEFSGKPFAVINENKPNFTDSELTTQGYEKYSELDSLGRCGTATACACRDIMPTEEREGIGQVKPSGWHTVKYDNISGKYLYNRCHLIGFQLSGENANEKNLITGTRYMNTEGMLPFENMVADYIKETDNHVMYRVTPVFYGDDLVARGVQMEAFSVEDSGDGICYNVFIYNSQPGIEIDYATGDSRLAENAGADKPDMSGSDKQNDSNQAADNNQQSGTYILNKSTKKFHYPSCRSAKQIKDENRAEFSGDRNELIADNYSPCKNCNP